MKSPDRFDKYLALAHWARNRYARPDGSLVITHGGKPSTYSTIEKMAAEKYLGCKLHPFH